LWKKPQRKPKKVILKKIAKVPFFVYPRLKMQPAQP